MKMFELTFRTQPKVIGKVLMDQNSLIWQYLGESIVKQKANDDLLKSADVPRWNLREFSIESGRFQKELCGHRSRLIDHEINQNLQKDGHLFLSQTVRGSRLFHHDHRTSCKIPSELR